ncbi:carboxypeptidase regulatory-like domain-containing protein [Phenylobacterium sp. 20VBR1]|uniref:Carboxypeptidase regulatory-like domain-containing protein n=1 Tax=Phenylobacterium glaciei TaxID=2803784 RepID=A0A941HV66_9CAUL|nr:TonB-dependent receptor [Phenylobacterium glaciei]MBR7618300.1 carboxypeptidase regulatory-like domain-containing protein [Phenylobacterium glaciei]
MKRLAGGAALSVLVCAMSSAVYAQETTSAVGGSIVDQSGAPVRGASVAIVHTPSGTRSQTATATDGSFSARGLRPGGPYTLTFTAPGYDAKSLTGVNLVVGANQRLDVNMNAQDLVDEFVVTASRDVTANNTGRKTVLDETAVESVVSVNRDVRDLARRSALVSQNTRGDGGISIGGSNPRQNRITIDGATAVDNYGLNTGGTPTIRGPVVLDAVQQFTIDAVPTDVENGDFQGGALDVVLKAGGNDFHGSLFSNYLNDGMVGDAIRNAPVRTIISQSNYGGFLSGPILKDKLFFALSYERYESLDLTSTGPVGGGFGNDVNGVSQATIDTVTNIFNTQYASKFDVGTLARTKPVVDEKYSAKLDWNITDRQRLSLTARYALSELYSRTDLSRTSAGLDSHWYLTGEEDYSYVGELNSDWTDNFHTQIRLTYRDYERRQLPPSGQEFADISVCTAPTSINSGGDNLTSCGATSVVRFGPDEFRQANQLATETFQVQAKGEYSLGDNLIKFGYQLKKQNINNLFVPTSDGVYYFDSINDFQNGTAGQLRYANSVGGKTVESSAAILEYMVHSLYLQDALAVTPDLNITAGFRYDWFVSDSVPILNPNFVARNNFSNQATYDGRGIMMPRVSFDWKPIESVKINGGAGLFSGGVPDVLIANSFGNGNGIQTSGIQIQRTATGFQDLSGTPGFTPAIGASALNINRADPRFGYDIPAPVLAFQGGSVASPLAEVSALSPNYQLPSDWKAFLSANWDTPWYGVRLGLDLVGSKTRDGILIKDTRAQPLIVNGAIARTPDGRIRYDAIGATTAATAAARTTFNVTSQNPGGSTRDLVVFNDSAGRGFTVAVSASKTFDFGLDVRASYTHSDIKDRASSLRFSSTQNSLYGGISGDDPNGAAYGTSFDSIDHAYKLDVSYAHKFFGDNETRVTLFGERRSGRPTSFVMSDATSGRGPVFGVNRGNFLLYVPQITGEVSGPTDLDVGLVTFDTAATRDSFIAAVNKFGLTENAVQEKGSYTNHDINQVDLQLSQEIPSPIAGHKFRLTFDVQNLLNLINNKWGVFDEYTDTDRLISVACADATGAAVTATSPNPFACNRYRYSSFQTTGTQRNLPQDIKKSLWAIQVGLRYEF